jgi:hypothetical protein
MRWNNRQILFSLSFKTDPSQANTKPLIFESKNYTNITSFKHSSDSDIFALQKI